MTKLAISDIAWNPSEEDEVFKLMKDLEIYNLEVSPFKLRDDLPGPEDASVKERIYKLNQYGISIVALQSLMYRYSNLTIFESVEIRKKTLSHLLKLINFSNEVGAKVLVFGSPKNKIKGTLSDSKALKIAIDFFSIIGKKAESLGIKFCIEPTPAAYGADFIRNTQEAINLLDRVGSKGLGLNMDLGSLIMNNENKEDTILKAMHYASHIHISEPFLKTINLDYDFHDKISNIVKSENYKGVVSVEMLFKEGSNLDSIKETLSFVKNIYT